MTPEELDRCKRRIAAYCHITQMLVGELADAQSEIETAEAAEVAVTADEIQDRLHDAIDLAAGVTRTLWRFDDLMAEDRYQPSREMNNEPKPVLRLCPLCKGTGIDPTLPQRYTTGGHDDRSCPRCGGECHIEVGQERLDRKTEGTG